MAAAGAASSPKVPLLQRKKITHPEGTWEDPSCAFQLFLSGSGRAPPIFGFTGFHSIPQLSCYTDKDYTPALPMALLSLPLSDPAKQLPGSISSVLATCLAAGLISKEPELYVILHTELERRVCGHLTCDSTLHFNVLFHSWIFQGDNVSHSAEEILAPLHCGVFEPCGVTPAHQELKECGIAFGKLSRRVCLLHDWRFSPNNCNLSLLLPEEDGGAGMAGAASFPCSHCSGGYASHSGFIHFWTMAVDKALRKAVIALHIVPVKESACDATRAWMKGRDTLGEFVTGLRENLPSGPYAAVKGLLDPLLAIEGTPALPVPVPLGKAAAGAAGAVGGGEGGLGAAGGAGAALALSAAAAASYTPA